MVFLDQSHHQTKGDRENGIAIQVFGSAFCVSDVEEALNIHIGEHGQDGWLQE